MSWHTSSNGAGNRRAGSYRPALELFRAARARTLEMVRPLTQAQLDERPAAGRWSIGEVLDHLLLGEKFNRELIVALIEMKRAGRRPFIKLGFADVNVSVAYLPRSLLPLAELPLTLFNAFLPGGVRDFIVRRRLLPARNADATRPRRARPAAELRRELAASLSETEALLESHPDLDYAEMRVQHPLLGNNDVPGLLRFLAHHEQRHQSQIADTLDALRRGCVRGAPLEKQYLPER